MSEEELDSHLKMHKSLMETNGDQIKFNQNTMEICTGLQEMIGELEKRLTTQEEHMEFVISDEKGIYKE